MTMKPCSRPPVPPRLLAAALAGLIALGGLAPASDALAQQGSRRAAVASAQKVTVNFVNAEIDAVARAMAAIVKRQIVVDPRVRGQMTLYSEQPLTEREAFLNFMSALRGLGFTVIEVSGLLKVVPEAEAKLQTGTVSVGQVVRSGDQILTQVFSLKHENVNNLVTVLRPLISPNNTINANPGNNTLIITDYADNLQRLAKIIAALDTPAATDVEVVPVRHAVASDIAQMVQRFADSSAGGTPGAPPATTGGAVSVLADPRTNALLIRAPNAARLAAIRAVIAKLDQPPTGAEATGNIRVVYLKNADATRLATVLRAAFSAGGSGGGAGASGGLSGAGGLGSSTAASGGGLGTMAGQNGSNGASTQSTSPVNAAASPSTGGFIQADPATNALIITAPEPMYRQLRAVIDQLDARRAQVYVESMIVKIDANKTAEFGFQWQGLLGKNGDKYGLVAGTNYGATGNIVNLSTTTTSSLSATTTASSLLGNGLNVGLIQAVNGVYTLGALARFLESEAGANVLSTPNLVALDNEEAKIVIGQNVPFVTGSFTGTGSSSNSTNPFQTIERKDVGLTLRLKPQIGENGTVRMQVYQENSSVVSTSTTSGPTTDKSAIETTVVVDDGQIMVLGGLLKDEFGDGEDRVPGLASLPLVGNLFKSGSRKRVKTNLLVFLRPVVMRTQADATALTLDRYEAIRARQQTSQPTPSATLGNINDAPVLPALPERPAATPSAPMAPTAPAAPRTPASSNGSLP